MADQGEFRRPSEIEDGTAEGGELRRVAPGRRTLTQTIGGASGSGAPASPGKMALTHRLPMDLPYRGEMESAFGHDFSGVEVSGTTRDALGGAGGMAQGESVAFAGTPSKHTVAHELAHVVQHRQGLTGGQAYADTGTSAWDKMADKWAAVSTAYNSQRAKLPRPLVIEIIGDRFTVSCETDAKNQLVLAVRYDGPFETGGDYVKDRVLKIPAARLPDQTSTPLDVQVVEVHDRGIRFDLTGTGLEIAELTFDPRPHAEDPDARTHWVKTRTSNVEGSQYKFHILLPSKDRPAPAGMDPKQLERQKSSSVQVKLGPDAFQLTARRLGESKNVGLHFDGVGALRDSQNGDAALSIPIASEEASIVIAVLEQSDRELRLDLDGDSKEDVRLVYTAEVSAARPDGTQTHTHYVDAYDPNQVEVAKTWFQVKGTAWDIPAALDRKKTPPPDSAAVPIDQDAAQGNRPTEGSQPIQLRGGDWELRIDGDGDRQKEILLRFHQTDWGKPVTITVIQVSSKKSSSFTTAAWEDNEPSQLEPELTQATDGKSETFVRLFPSRSAGLKIHLLIAPPVDEGEERVYKLTVRSPSVDDQEHSARFPKETQAANPLLADPKNNKRVAGIESMTARLGELGDPFLFAIEKSPGGMTLGIAGLNPDGSMGGSSGHRLNDLQVKTFKVLEVTPTLVKLDVTGDDTPDIIVRDAISQPLGRDSSRQLIVERQHTMALSGPALAGDSGAIFQLRGRQFIQGSQPDEAGREGAGAAAAVVGIQNQQQEGADINQLIGRFQAGVSAQILKAGERGFISQKMVESWKGLSEEMIQLDAFGRVPAADKPKVARREGEVRAAAIEHANTLYAELAAATVNERKSEPSQIEGEGDVWSNPYTGASLEEHKGKSMGDGYNEPSTFTEIAPGGASRVGAFLSKGDDAHAAFWWGKLQSGVERWAQTRLERELGPNDPTVKQGKYMSAMAGKLDEIRSKRNVQRVYATFTADEMYRGEKDFFQVMPLQLWAWQDGDGDWTLRDLTNPEKPFDGHASPEYHRVNKAGDRPDYYPPHHLFNELNDKKKFPKGLIRYEIPGTGFNGQVTCEAKKKWYEWVQDIGLALAAIGLGLVTFGAGTVAVVGSYVLAASALAGAVAAGGELADAYEHGWLDGMLVLVNLLQIAGSVASAGSIVAGNLVRGARAASAAVEAGEKGAALWSGRLAKLAAMADKAYIPLTATALGTDVATVVVMAVDLKNKLAEIDAAGLPKDQADEAKMKLLAMFALTGGLTVLSIKGDLPEIRNGRGPTIVLDNVNGMPVAYAGGVRAGKAEINVSPRLGPDGKPVIDPNMHATARWQTREQAVKGLSEDELTWYRTWMEQPEKVKFKPNGEPEIKIPDGLGPPSPALEAKLKDMVKNTDLALYDKAWARTGDLEAVREASGGKLDIDPTSPIWPTERPKIKEKLAWSLGSERRAEEALSHYEAIRTGSRGPGHELHAAQAAKLGKVLPDGEIDQLRRMFPECEVYVTGGAIAEPGVDPLKSVDVVVVVPPGTAPDLMAAMELRASGTRLRPDPDYVKAHPTMEANATLEVKAKAVTRDQLFGLSSARVKGKAPIDLHRIDVPTGPGGRPYTAAELDAMSKGGYEYDPATGGFAPRSAEARSALKGSAVGPLRGPNTVCGGALPSEAVGEEILHKLAAGDVDALRVVGVEPPVDFDPRKNEWALGQRESDKQFVLIRGSYGEVDWSQLPGIKARGHSHPITDPFTGKPRVLKGENGNDWVTIDLLKAGKGGDSMMYLAPSGSDFAFAAAEGKHLVVTPFCHLGGGRIAAPKEGATGPLVQFEILSSRPAGLYDQYEMMVYEADVRISAGGEVLFEGKMWAFQGGYSDVRFKKPDNMRPVPADFKVGEWSYHPGAAGAGAGKTATGSVALTERLKRLGLPDAATDPDMARVMSHIDARTEADLHHLLDLQAKGQVKGLDDWYKGIKDESQADRLDNMMAELREARRLADENPGAIIDLGMDARAPMKHKKAADGTWHETLDKDKSFDIEVIDPTSGGVSWSSEIKTIQAPVQDAPDLTKAVNNAAEKVESRLANKPGNQIPGKKEVRIEISLYQGEQSIGGTAKIVYDGAGMSTRMNGTTVLPGSAKKPNPANLFVEVEKNLNTPGSNALKHLDRVTLVDASGILARYDKVGGAFVRVF